MQHYHSKCRDCQKSFPSLFKATSFWRCPKCSTAFSSPKAPEVPTSLIFTRPPVTPATIPVQHDPALPDPIKSLLFFSSESDTFIYSDGPSHPLTRNVLQPHPEPSRPADFTPVDMIGVPPLPPSPDSFSFREIVAGIPSESATGKLSDLLAPLHNRRQGRVDFNKPVIRPSTAQGRANKTILMNTKTQLEAHELLRQRNRQVHTLGRKTDSIRTSLGHFAVWRQFAIEVAAVSPYRWIWGKRSALTPLELAQEDGLFEWFATYTSIRYDTSSAVDQAIGAVVVFHESILRLPKPPMPICKRFLKSLSKVMLKEVPTRKARNTLEPRHVKAITTFFTAEIAASQSTTRKALLANIRALVAAAATAGFRVGELAVDKQFKPKSQSEHQIHWTRLTLQPCVAHTKVGAPVLIPPPLRKMEGANALSTEKANQVFPFLFDPGLPYCFVQLVKEMAQLDPVPENLKHCTPAFRNPTLPGSPAISPTLVCAELRRAFEECFAAEQEMLALTIGDHSLRKCANVAAQAAGASEAQVMAWFGWISDSKRLYDEAILEDCVEFQRKAQTVDYAALSALSAAKGSHSRPQMAADLARKLARQ
jgi:DNA-directed RNA polymerase subunit RPC12/RpoP